MVGRAALNTSSTAPCLTYWFKGSQYFQYKWTPATAQHDIIHGPVDFANDWGTLKQAGFTQIDAILPIPSSNRAYFFSGSQYIRIQYEVGSPNDVVVGPAKAIHSGWGSLKEAGFGHIDGALIVPGKTDEAYFFCGEQYARVWFQEAKGNELREGPLPIESKWPGGFRSIETIIPRPGNEQNAYIFSGSKYTQVQIVPDGTNQLVSDGQRDVASNWTGLRLARFY
ncbi:hypothetical protein RHS03_06047, partial [Rhizoctonia solani]